MIHSSALRLFVLPALWTGLAAVAGATVLNVGTVEQPVNLGTRSDPDRIPLGPVVVESNHDYGIHSVISEPRPCTHGALALDNGLELNMNLASAFGIEVSPDDPTQVPRVPVTIVVKDWPVPTYSPYTKDQVLAATLHCLLRSVHAPPDTPLKVVINAANEEDALNLAGYAGNYLTAEAGEQGGPTPVPGTRIETDARGVSWVTFPHRKPGETVPEPRDPPILIPFFIPDETDDLSFDLIPVWTGDSWKEDPLKVLLDPITLFYDRYDKTQSSGPDINAFTRLGLLNQRHWNRAVDGLQLTVQLENPGEERPPRIPATLSAFCYAAVLSIAPPPDAPLTLAFRVQPELLAELEVFRKDPAWSLVELDEHESILSCQFVWDQAARALVKGSIPLGYLNRPADRPWSIGFAPLPAAEDPPAPERLPGTGEAP